MKRKRDKNNRKPCVGDYQPKIIQKIRGFYDMNKTLSRKMFGGESATDMDPFRATARTVQVNRPETHEQEFAERIEQSDNKVRLEHSASKSRSSKSPPKSQRHTNRKQHKSGIGYFENQFPKVRLTSSGGADNQFRRSGSGVVSVNELKTARNTHSTLMRMTTRPQSEQRDEYTLFGERNSVGSYAKQYNNYDFSKAIPRDGLKKVKSTKNQAAYNPSYKMIEKKSDKLCIPFSKLVGRSVGEISTRVSEHSLPTKMRILSQLEKREQLTHRLNSLEKVSQLPKTGTAPETKQRGFWKTGNLPKTKTSKETEYSGGVVQVPRDKSAVLKMAMSPFPTWLQKASNTNRLGLTTQGEKACEMNHFSAGSMRTHQDLGKKYPGHNKKLERFRIKDNQEDEDEEEDIEDLASVEYNM